MVDSAESSSPPLARLWSVMPAAGRGQRMNTSTAKQYLKIHQRCIIEYSLTRLLNFPKIEKVVVCVSQNDQIWPRLSYARHPRVQTELGGTTRARSVLNGLLALRSVAEPQDWVLVHDAARPCLAYDDLSALVDHCRSTGDGAILAAPVVDTLKKSSDGNKIDYTVDRQQVVRALTPQMFRFDLLLDALTSGLELERDITDEASAVEQLGAPVELVFAKHENPKVTTPADLSLATFLLQNENAQITESDK